MSISSRQLEPAAARAHPTSGVNGTFALTVMLAPGPRVRFGEVVADGGAVGADDAVATGEGDGDAVGSGEGDGVGTGGTVAVGEANAVGTTEAGALSVGAGAGCWPQPASARARRHPTMRRERTRGLRWRDGDERAGTRATWRADCTRVVRR